jgi:ABC-type multidrug transport system fused ATPase/permease subunit
MFIKATTYCTVVLVMFFYISWKMTLFTLGVMLPGSMVVPVWGKFKRKIEKEVSDSKAEASNVAEEAFTHIRTVKAFATEEDECVHYQEKNLMVYKLQLSMAFWYGGFSFAMIFVMFGSLDALVWFAAYLNDSDGLTIGEFTSF